MQLSKAEALERYDSHQYISYQFTLYNDQTQSFYHVTINHDQAKRFRHQFVTISAYEPVNTGYYYNSHNLTRYKITIVGTSESIYACLRKSTPELKAYTEFTGLIATYPQSYVYYLGDLEETDNTIDLITFVDIELFINHYNENGILPKSMVTIIQKYALNQYKIHRLKDCGEELEYDQLSPNFKLKLFDYQAQTLTWMIRTENVDYKFLVPQSSFFKLADHAYIELVQKDDEKDKTKANFLSQFIYDDDYQTNEMVKCRGGILADIMGNGKTITAIALIYHNRPAMFPMLTTIIEREVYVPSRATLVICPTNIADQWSTEIDKCLGNSSGITVIKITTKQQLSRYTLAQLVNADVIITTYDWLSHTNHIGTGFVKKNKASDFLADQKRQKIKYGDQYHLYSNFTLLFIKYYRIIYDEFHEELDSSSNQNTTLYIIKNCLRSKNTWGISGTPLLDNEKIMGNIPDLLRVNDSHNNIYELDDISQHAVYDRYVRRNEKQYLPELIHTIVNVKQTVQERQLYDSSLSQPTETLLQLCCYHNLNNLDVQNIDDVTKVQNQSRLKQKTELQSQIADLKINIGQIVSVLQTLNPTITDVSELFYLVDSNHPKHTHKLVQQIQMTPTLQLQVDSLRQYRKYEKSLQIKTEEFDKLEQCIAYYEKTVEQALKGSTFICPITGEVLGDGEVVITKDGNLFGKSSIEMLFECGDGKFITCPVTGKTLTRADLTVVTNQKVDTNSNSNERLFGSKITAIITKIKSLKPEEKVIIFGQWEKLLGTISYALVANGIDHTNIKGAIGTRDKSIREFQQNPKIRAILLSSVYGASGVNLTEATHVFIVHPFHETDGIMYEKQAIGRAWRTGQTKPVTVSYFITEKTIEEELWSKNRKDAIKS
jgi:SNF2 family DNA or RNA helicase